MLLFLMGQSKDRRSKYPPPPKKKEKKKSILSPSSVLELVRAWLPLAADINHALSDNKVNKMGFDIITSKKT